MSTHPPDVRHAAHPRPLEGLSIGELAQRGGELARRWAIALILQRPPERIGEIALSELAIDGPALCRQALWALAREDALERLLAPSSEPRPDRAPVDLPARLGSMTGARDAADMVAAVEALRIVLWEALAAEMRSPSARAACDAADRLAHVCARLAASAVHGAQLPRRAQPSARAGEGPPLVERSPGADAGTPARIVDERSELYHDAGPQQAPPRARIAPREIAVHDQRSGEGPAAWIDSIGRQLERFHERATPFAVLLVQVSRWAPGGLYRSTTAEAGGREQALETLLSGVVDGTLPELLPGTPTIGDERGSLTRERAGRYWLIVPGLDRAGAQLLAERLTREVSSATSPPGQALEVAIGTASCPRDGHDAAALAAHADVGLYAARAAAREAALPFSGAR
ncbi:MAG TPA: hypothetical protein VKG82_01440 [Solirubrobacteraceae bacterium]|nr:hypothetical protein [Solirubrobacteraceae bacterium]